MSGLTFLGTVYRNSPLGHAVFHLGYLLPATRGGFLAYYQWVIKAGSGYFPSSVDQFLTDRLWYSKGTAEEQAIIDFQIRQGSGRWGRAIFDDSEQLQGQVISNIVARLDQMSDRDVVSAILYIEAIRQGRPLGKYGLNGIRTWDEEQEVYVTEQEALERLKANIYKWWGDGTAWPQNRQYDFFSSTGVSLRPHP